MSDRFKNFRLIGAIVISLLLVLIFNGNIKNNHSWTWLENIIHPQKNIFSLKIDYNKILTDVDSQDSFVMSEVKFAPIPPTVTPTLIPPPPTQIPTQYIRSNYVVPIRRYIPPTLSPAATTIPPTPIPKKIGNLPLDEPLKQPYYGVPSRICYTPEYFISYYGGDLSPNRCYANVRANVEANLVNVNILGRSLPVHKLAAPYFEAVGKELAVYQKDSKTFEFPSKTYTINTIGTYVFRCNTNASTGDTWDTCQSGCVIGTHAFGIAIDINWVENCNGCANYDLPHEISDAFERWGFRWGGRYKELFGARIDAMHFEYMYDMCKDL